MIAPYEFTARHIAKKHFTEYPDCPVCTGDFTESSFLLLHCGHPLCVACQLKLTKNNCPTCNARLRKNTDNPHIFSLIPDPLSSITTTSGLFSALSFDGPNASVFELEGPVSVPTGMFGAPTLNSGFFFAPGRFHMGSGGKENRRIVRVKRPVAVSTGGTHQPVATTTTIPCLDSSDSDDSKASTRAITEEKRRKWLNDFEVIQEWMAKFAQEVLLFREQELLEIESAPESLVGTVLGVAREETALQRNKLFW